MLSLAITFILFVYFLKSFRKGIILIAMIAQPLKYIGSGIGEISMYYIFAYLGIVFLLFTKYRKNIRTYPKLIFISTFLMAASFLATTLITTRSFEIVISNILTQLVFPVVFWCVLSNADSVKFSLKCILCLCVISIIALIPELALKHNYVTDLISNSFVTSDFIIDADSIRFGLKRANSIFSYFSTFGVFCCLATFIVWIVNKLNIENNTIYKILIFVLPFGALATGSRAIFLGIMCILIGLFTSQDVLKSRYFKIIAIICIIGLPFVYDYIGVILDSMINSDSSKAAQGSSSDLRMLQWEACLPSFLHSPIWGNGRMYIWEQVAPYNPILLGAESLWFSLLVDYGIMGGITYTLMIISCCYTLWRIERRLIMMPIAYFLILSLSPDVGIEYNMLLTFVILSIKIYKFYPLNKQRIIKISKILYIK